MINTLRLTHLILFLVVLGYMFRSSLTIIRPVCESCKTRFTNGPDNGQWRPKHVAQHNMI